jgi:hypothetical protein
MSQYPPEPPVPPPPDAPPPPPGSQGLPSRSLGEILSGAFDIYAKNAQGLLLIVAVVVVPLSVLSFLLSHFLFAPDTKEAFLGGQTVTITEGRSFGLVLLASLSAAAIAVIISAVLQAALLRAATQATIGDPVDLDASYRWGFQRFASVLWVSILVGLAVAIGFVLLIIPGIILLVMFEASVPVVVVEGSRGTQAMRRSWELVRGHFWHVLGVIVVAALITAVVSGILGAIGSANAVLSLIFTTIAQIIVAPFSALVAVLLYLDLRARTERVDAATLRAQLGEV